ncbi:hypothetical protein fugu_001486 [Takifugu bimaculatus]|uniref:Uncharacterized protein n=1 Tax=Takifugu bimaculatus TaxID=433685 RepID=A0A4Z2CJL1_9TELE|nr:hypothetical protein fugu_001486 [Takifugu bimaculatus]
MVEQRLAVCRSNSIQKCGQAHFVLGGTRGLQVVCRAASSGGPHKWNITGDISAFRTKTTMFPSDTEHLAAFWAPEDRNKWVNAAVMAHIVRSNCRNAPERK